MQYALLRKGVLRREESVAARSHRMPAPALPSRRLAIAMEICCHWQWQTTSRRGQIRVLQTSRPPSHPWPARPARRSTISSDSLSPLSLSYTGSSARCFLRAAARQQRRVCNAWRAEFLWSFVTSSMTDEEEGKQKLANFRTVPV